MSYNSERVIGMSMVVEELLDDFRRKILNELDRTQDDLDSIFKDALKKLINALDYSFSVNRFNARYLEEYVNDSLYDLRNKVLKERINGLEQELLTS